MDKPTRVFGIDFGLKRIGIAISDERHILASPIAIYEAEYKMEKTVEKIAKILFDLSNDYRCNIEKIVIGMPYMLSGKKGMLADEVTIFINLLKNHFSCPIIAWDERLTSVQAERAMREAKMSRKKRSKVVDKISAVIILQNYLDNQQVF